MMILFKRSCTRESTNEPLSSTFASREMSKPLGAKEKTEEDIFLFSMFTIKT